MKMRRSIILFVIIVAALIALVLWHGRKLPVETPPAAETNTVQTAIVTKSPMPSLPIGTNPSITQVASNGNPISKLSVKNQEQQMRQELSELNDVDVVFYGRLEDQFGNAVGNTTIKFEIPFNNGYDVGVHRGTTQADENGFFTVNGYKGKSLDIVPVKQGYVLDSTNGGGIYSHLWSESQRARPDPNNPVIIKMWKLQGAEPLVDIGNEYRLPFTGNPVFFDLSARKIVPAGGDLEVIVTRASGSISQRQHGDWSVELRSIGGGIIESDYRSAQFAFEAPADGYKESYFLQMHHDQHHWSDGFQKEFFLKSRDGQIYAKFYLVFGINREPNEPLYFQFRGVANTNNSRNWEATVPQ
jgi:hypothetical protein